MKRHIFNIAVAVSLAGFLAVIWLWVTSYWQTTYVYLEVTTGENLSWDAYHLVLASGSGELALTFTKFALRNTSPIGAPSPLIHWSIVDEVRKLVRADGSFASRLGFQYRIYQNLSHYPHPDSPSGALPVIVPPMASEPSIRTDQKSLIVPAWLVELLALLLPICWVAKFCRKRRRMRLGLCFRCGYDLRATKEQCPECGTPVSQGTS